MEKRAHGPVVITHPDGTKICFVPLGDFRFKPIDLATGMPYKLMDRMNVVGKG